MTEVAHPVDVVRTRDALQFRPVTKAVVGRVRRPGTLEEFGSVSEPGASVEFGRTEVVEVSIHQDERFDVCPEIFRSIRPPAVISRNKWETGNPQLVYISAPGVGLR